MKGRKGMEAGLSLVLIMMAVIGLVLILIMTGIFSGGTERSEKQMKDAIDSSDIACPTICFQCCNGIKDPGQELGGTCEKPICAPKDKNCNDLAKCSCNC